MSVLLGRPLDHGVVRIEIKKHILPPLAGLLVMLAVYSFINIQLLSAKFMYTFNAPTINLNLPSNPVLATAPDNQDRIIIPKINVEAPVVFDEPSRQEWAVQLALRRGVLHYDGTAEPGKKGNGVYFGHSSGYPWAPGDYKFVFTLLEKLEQGDLIYVDHAGVRHTYLVTGKRVTDPNDETVLSQATDERDISVVTCTPVGTSKQRLVVSARLQSVSLD